MNSGILTPDLTLAGEACYPEFGLCGPSVSFLVRFYGGHLVYFWENLESEQMTFLK